MRSMWKRTLATMLTVCMIVSMLVVPAGATRAMTGETVAEPAAAETPAGESSGGGSTNTGTVGVSMGEPAAEMLDAPADGKYILDPSNLGDSFAYPTKTGEDNAVKAGTNEYFSVTYGGGLDTNNTGSGAYGSVGDDDYMPAATKSFKFSTAASESTFKTKHSIKFTITNQGASIKIWYYPGSNANRGPDLYDTSFTAKTLTGDRAATKSTICCAKGNLTATGDYWIAETTGTIYILKVEVTDKVTGWAVDYTNVSNLTAKASTAADAGAAPKTVAKNAALDVYLVAEDCYTLPETLTSVTMGGAELAAGNAETGYTYDNTTGWVHIKKVTGNVVITAAGVKNAWDVTYTLTNLSAKVSATADAADAPVLVTKKNGGGALDAVLVPASGKYELPEALTSVTMDGTSLEAGSGYTYNNTTGAVHIAQVTGDVVITATAQERAGEPTTSVSITVPEGGLKVLTSGTLNLQYTYEGGEPWSAVWTMNALATTPSDLGSINASSGAFTAGEKVGLVEVTLKANDDEALTDTAVVAVMKSPTVKDNAKIWEAAEMGVGAKSQFKYTDSEGTKYYTVPYDGYFTLQPINQAYIESSGWGNSSITGINDVDFNTQGGSSATTSSIAFETEKAAMVQIWWRSGSSSESEAKIFGSTADKDVTVGSTKAGTLSTAIVPSQGTEATWAIGASSSSLRFYKVAVTEFEVTKVTVKNGDTEVSSLAMTVGDDDVTLTADVAVTPSVNELKGVTWASSAESVATVTDGGVVHAVAEGTANITATALDGTTVATVVVTVSPADPNASAAPVFADNGHIWSAATAADKAVTFTLAAAPDEGTTFALYKDGELVKGDVSADGTTLTFDLENAPENGTYTVTATESEKTESTGTAVVVNPYAETYTYTFDEADYTRYYNGADLNEKIFDGYFEGVGKIYNRDTHAELNASTADSEGGVKFTMTGTAAKVEIMVSSNSSSAANFKLTSSVAEGVTIAVDETETDTTNVTEVSATPGVYQCSGSSARKLVYNVTNTTGSSAVLTFVGVKASATPNLTSIKVEETGGTHCTHEPTKNTATNKGDVAATCTAMGQKAEEICVTCDNKVINSAAATLPTGHTFGSDGVCEVDGCNVTAPESLVIILRDASDVMTEAEEPFASALTMESSANTLNGTAVGYITGFYGSSSFNSNTLATNVVIDGATFNSRYLKMSGTSYVNFRAPADGTLTLYANSENAGAKNFKLQPLPSGDEIVTTDLPEEAIGNSKLDKGAKVTAEVKGNTTYHIIRGASKTMGIYALVWEAESSSAETYTVTAVKGTYQNANANLTVALEGVTEGKAAQGDEITVSLSGDDAAKYEIAKVIAYETENTSNTVEVTGNTFTMPAAAVTVKAIITQPALTGADGDVWNFQDTDFATEDYRNAGLPTSYRGLTLGNATSNATGYLWVNTDGTFTFPVAGKSFIFFNLYNNSEITVASTDGESTTLKTEGAAGIKRYLAPKAGTVTVTGVASPSYIQSISVLAIPAAQATKTWTSFADPDNKYTQGNASAVSNYDGMLIEGTYVDDKSNLVLQNSGVTGVLYIPLAGPSKVTLTPNNYAWSFTIDGDTSGKTYAGGANSASGNDATTPVVYTAADAAAGDILIVRAVPGSTNSTYFTSISVKPYVAPKYKLTLALTNLTSDTAAGNEVFTQGVAKTITLTPASGYKAPESVAVTVGEAAAEFGTDFTYTVAPDTGVVTVSITAAAVTGDITITAAAVLDTTALDNKIAEAEDLLKADKKNYVISTNGKDVLKSAKWMTQAEEDALTSAIATAKGAAPADPEAVTVAVSALDTAITTFKQAKKAGLKVVIASVQIQKDNADAGEADTLTAGDEATYTALVTVDSTSATATTGDKAVTWTVESANPAGCVTIANASAGTIVAVKAGTATLKATSVSDGTTSGVKVVDSITITVNKQPAGDAPNLTGNNATDGENNGSITGLTDGVTYEYVTGETANWTGTPTEATGPDAIGDLAPGTYHIRVKATDAAEASEVKTIVIKMAVSSVTLTHSTEGHTIYEEGNNVVGGKDNLNADHPKQWKLEATVAPANATNKNLNWTSDTPTIATVNDEGVVTAVKPGQATITVASADDSTKSATITITVKAYLKSVSIDNGDTATLAMGETLTLTGSVEASASATTGQKKITWSTTDNDHITVDAETGVITPKAVTTEAVTVTATVGTAPDVVTDTIAVSVTKGTFTTLALTANNAKLPSTGGTVTLTVNGLPEGELAHVTVAKDDSSPNAPTSCDQVMNETVSTNKWAVVLPENSDSTDKTYVMKVTHGGSTNWTANPATQSITLTVSGTGTHVITAELNKESPLELTVGEPALSVTATAQLDGAADTNNYLGYQWAKWDAEAGEGAGAYVDISGATSATLSLEHAVTLEDAGKYRLTISINDTGTATGVTADSYTAEITVKVSAPPLTAITATPGTDSAGVAYTGTSVALTGDVTATYTITTTPASDHDDQLVYVIGDDTIVAVTLEGGTLTIHALAGTAEGATTTVTVKGKTHSDVTAEINVTVKLADAPAAPAVEVTAHGNGTGVIRVTNPVEGLRYEYSPEGYNGWYDMDDTGAGDNRVVSKSNLPANEYAVRVKVDPNYQKTGASATVEVKNIPTITVTTPATNTVTLTSGGKMTLTVDATISSGTLTYSWKRGGEVQSATTRTIEKANVTVAGDNNVVYTCTIGDSANLAQSQTVTFTLTVNPKAGTTPSADFDAATMTLTGVDTSMEVQVPGSDQWDAVTGSSMTLDFTTAGNLKVKQPATAEATEAVQTIAITKAATPTLSAGDGTVTITNYESGNTYQTSANGTSGWTDATPNASGEITAPNGTAIYVRVKAAGTVLASDAANATPTATVVAVTGITVKDGEAAAQASYELEVNGTKALTVTIEPDNATTKGFTASSADDAKVEVTPASGTSGGTVTITGKAATTEAVKVTIAAAGDATKKVEINVTVKAAATPGEAKWTDLDYYVTETLGTALEIAADTTATKKGVTIFYPEKFKKVDSTSTDANDKAVAEAANMTYVKGSTNISSASANPPTSGAYYKFTIGESVAEGSVLTLAIGSFGKTLYINDVDGTGTSALMSDIPAVPSGNSAVELKIPVTAGHTYYFYATGGKVGLFGFKVGVPATTVTVSPKTANINVGSTTTLTATATNDATVTWASDNTAVATVNETTGEVTGMGAGTATITATATKDGETDTASATITVVPAGTYVLNPAFDMDAGGVTTATTAGTNNYFTITPKTGTNTTVDSSSNKTFESTFTSSQRLKLGGTLTPTSASDGPAVSFNTNGAATVKIYWVRASADNRQVILVDSAANTLGTTSQPESTTENGTKDDPLVDTFTGKITTAGTYYLGSNGGNVNIYRIEVVESTPATPTTYSITLPAAENGNTVTATKTSGIAEGVEVTVTVKPASGYKLTALTGSPAISLKTAIPAEGITTQTDLKFNMPAGNTTLTATWASTAPASKPLTAIGVSKTSVSLVGTSSDTVTITTTPADPTDTVKILTQPTASVATASLSADGKTLTITGVAPGTTSVVLSGTTATSVTKTVSITVTAPAAEITATAVGETTRALTEGDSVELEVTASATQNATLKYQWKKDGSAISGATAAKLSLTDVKTTDAGTYTCQVSATGAVTKTVDFTVTVAAAPADTFKVTIASATGGTVTASKSANLHAGDKVTLTVTPSSRYKLDSLVYTVGSDTTAYAVEQTDGAYSFLMPAANVNVKATFKSTSTTTGGGGGGTTTTPSVTPSTTTERNDDGSVTTTTVDKTGATTVTTVQPDGSAVETVTSPDGDVTVTATDATGEVLAEVSIPATAPSAGFKFVDVPDDHWAAASINKMAGMEVVKGVDEEARLFDMNSAITRGGVASILFRFANGKEGLECAFSDVADEQWYTDGVAWAAKVGVVTGYENGTFAPDGSITREQLAVMLYRYAKLLGMDTTASGDLSGFVDGVKVQGWAAQGMAWCVANGIMQGRGNAVLDPSSTATRAEAAVMLDRMISLLK